MSDEPGKPSYPTRAQWLASDGPEALRQIGRGGAVVLSATLLPGCGLLWTLVAPVFHHGEGWVAFGCKAGYWPAYISADEAIEAVRDELLAAGFKGIETGDKCPSYSADRLRFGMNSWEVLKGVKVSDHMDVCVPDENFAIEVVTKVDQKNFTTFPPIVTSVSETDYTITADYLVAQLSTGLSPCPRWAGVLYDPLHVDTGWDSGMGRDLIREESLEMLRMQVRDFLAWLAEEQE